MKLIRHTGLAAFACALLAFAAADAAAQAPTLTASANGAIVTINWTAIPGATGYNLVVTGSLNANVNLPASVTNIVVNAPAGTYTVQVRATAGSVASAFSNAASVTVGSTPPVPCGPPAAPTVTTAVNGGTVTVNYGAVAGATGYLVQFSRFPGATELQRSTNATSFPQFVGLIGTFYVRVVALTPCGNVTSQEAAFTIATLAGSGPRTPDPAPGTLLPAPRYGQDVVIATANAYGGDLQNSCVETGGNNVFMFRVLNALRQRDSRWGLNNKRGNQGLSQDIVTYNPGAVPDAEATQVYLFDIIGGHCGGNPTWNWGDVTDVTWAGGAAGLCSNFYCARWLIPAEYYRMGFQ